MEAVLYDSPVLLSVSEHKLAAWRRDRECIMTSFSAGTGKKTKQHSLNISGLLFLKYSGERRGTTAHTSGFKFGLHVILFRHICDELCLARLFWRGKCKPG